MKLHITKKMLEGNFIVFISVSDFNEEEKERMRKFGVPIIDLGSVNARYMGRIVNSLPIDEIDNEFRFSNEFLANTFAVSMKNKIEGTMKRLRALRDNFSSSKEYEV